VDAYDDSKIEKDLGTFDAQYALAACTASNGCFKKISQTGSTTSLPPADVSGWSVEITLDVETVHSVCPNCKIMLVEANSESFADLAASVNEAVNLGATEVSNSYGGLETQVAAPEQAAYDHPGVVIAASAGDSGYLNWDYVAESREAPGTPDAPAALPSVVAVGGTAVKLTATGTRSSESVWNDSGRPSVEEFKQFSATGGGCSTSFTAPSWQQSAPGWAKSACGTKRLDNDIAVVGDPYTGFDIYDSYAYEPKFTGGWLTVGGTSLSSPLVSGIYGLAGGSHGASYPAATLYPHVGDVSSLYDVTSGGNGYCDGEAPGPCGEPGINELLGNVDCEGTTSCDAAPGFDGPSGVGAPNGLGAFQPLGGLPATETKAASFVVQSSATLNAIVNPNGGAVSDCRFEYGTTQAYGSTVPCASLPGSGNTPVAVSAAVSGLSANTTYHFRVSATNAGGTSLGEDKSFTTQPSTPPPTVTTTAAAAVTRTLATLNGTVNPNGGTVSDCHFDYGTTESYGSSAPCSSLPGSGTSQVAVGASLGNLNPGSTYHFRVSATNAGGTSTGSDQTFTALAALPTPHWYKDGTKVALGEKSPLIGWGTLTLESSAGTATCRTVQAANVENTAGAATKEVVLFASFECKPVGGSCTGGEQRATPRHQPWTGTMLEEGEEGAGNFREEGWGIELNLECFKGGVNTANQLFKTGPVLAETGTFTPRWLNGTSATKPSEVFFDPASGHLYAEVEKAAVKGTTKGKLKFIGYADNAPVPLIALEKP
jgi:subtilase family serine protease